MVGRDTNTTRKGRRQGAISRSLDWAATLACKGQGVLGPQHLHFRRQPVGSQTTHFVLLDLSASMLRGQKLAWAKGCLLALTARFYRSRDHMAVIGFAGHQAQWLQKPAKVPAFNEHWIAPLRAGGGTPIQSAIDAVNMELKRYGPDMHACIWLLTDGRFDPLPPRPERVDDCYIIDFEEDVVTLQRCRRLAEQWKGQVLAASQFGALVNASN